MTCRMTFRMASSLLALHAVFTGGIGAFASGCVIPTPLEPSTSSNASPVIVKQTLDPPFAQPVTFNTREFHVEAQDLDIDDPLFAVLARANLSGDLTSFAKIQLVPVGSDNITL